jgi:hypothetical protein
MNLRGAEVSRRSLAKTIAMPLNGNRRDRPHDRRHDRVDFCDITSHKSQAGIRKPEKSLEIKQ